MVKRSRVITSYKKYVVQNQNNSSLPQKNCCVTNLVQSGVESKKEVRVFGTRFP